MTTPDLDTPSVTEREARERERAAIYQFCKHHRQVDIPLSCLPNDIDERYPSYPCPLRECRVGGLVWRWNPKIGGAWEEQVIRGIASVEWVGPDVRGPIPRTIEEAEAVALCLRDPYQKEGGE